MNKNCQLPLKLLLSLGRFYIVFKCIITMSRKTIQDKNHQAIEQKGMTFDHDFGYSFPLFSSLLKKGEEEKENE